MLSSEVALDLSYLQAESGNLINNMELYAVLITGEMFSFWVFILCVLPTPKWFYISIMKKVNYILYWDCELNNKAYKTAELSLSVEWEFKHPDCFIPYIFPIQSLTLPQSTENMHRQNNTGMTASKNKESLVPSFFFVLHHSPLLQQNLGIVSRERANSCSCRSCTQSPVCTGVGEMLTRGKIMRFQPLTSGSYLIVINHIWAGIQTDLKGPESCSWKKSHLFSGHLSKTTRIFWE